MKLSRKGKRRASSEVRKLVEFFRSEEGLGLGTQGDHDGLTPADAAIRAMRELLDLRVRAGRAASLLSEDRWSS